MRLEIDWCAAKVRLVSNKLASNNDFVYVYRLDELWKSELDV